MRRETEIDLENWSIIAIVFAAGVILATSLLGCAQTHQTTVALKCVDRPVTQLLPGEAELNSVTLIDSSTNKIPFIASPHRLVAICSDEEGPAKWGMETPDQGGFDEFSDPVKAGIEHFNYGF